jgi:hypothetical protein
LTKKVIFELNISWKGYSEFDTRILTANYRKLECGPASNVSTFCTSLLPITAVNLYETSLQWSSLMDENRQSLEALLVKLPMTKSPRRLCLKEEYYRWEEI